MMLRHGFSERGNMDRVLIFTRTKHGADRVVKLLAGNGIVSNAIHGNKSQPQRERALAEFKHGRAKILIATDIAARGIDVTGVSHVINFELPNVAEQYVHRIGRTARAGAAGVAIAFCADDEKAYLRDIEKLTRQRISVEPLPANFIAEAHRIKTTRTAPPPPTREERREEERGARRFPPARVQRGQGASPVGSSRWATAAGALAEGARSQPTSARGCGAHIYARPGPWCPARARHRARRSAAGGPSGSGRAGRSPSGGHA